MKKICLCIIFLGVTLHMSAQKSGEKLSVKTNSDTQWWAGIIREGHKMPLKPGYEADLYGQSWSNQLQPLLLSTSGELVWSEEPFRFRVETNTINFDNAHDSLQYVKAGTNLKEAYLYASKNYFYTIRKNAA